MSAVTLIILAFPIYFGSNLTYKTYPGNGGVLDDFYVNFETNNNNVRIEVRVTFFGDASLDLSISHGRMDIPYNVSQRETPFFEKTLDGSYKAIIKFATAGKYNLGITNTNYTSQDFTVAVRLKFATDYLIFPFTTIYILAVVLASFYYRRKQKHVSNQN